MIEALRDKVVLKRDDVVKKTASGIILSEGAQELSIEATVMSVGTGKVASDGTLIAPVVKVGDHVMIGKFVGTEAIIDGENFVIVVENDILGILGD